MLRLAVLRSMMTDGVASGCIDSQKTERTLTLPSPGLPGEGKRREKSYWPRMLPGAHAAVDQQHLAVNMRGAVAAEKNRGGPAHVGGRDLTVGRVMRDPLGLLGPLLEPFGCRGS